MQYIQVAVLFEYLTVIMMDVTIIVALDRRVL